MGKKKAALEEQKELQEKIQNMSPKELAEFRNTLDPDSMGFDGAEAQHEDNEKANTL